MEAVDIDKLLGDGSICFEGPKRTTTMTTSPSTTSSSGLYDWCDVATSVQRKTYSRKITAATSSSCKTLKKAKKQALLPTRTTFRQQHEAMQRRHGLTGCRFEPRSTAVSTAFAPQLPRLV
ncbi:hypothetical protein Ae201684_004797 [Aphanomyces euteiches]|uniref:Uncharacterized protein n=1 Tax=Aphanomyces euteiches TaxID=100861 RepID=A0A6G0XH71_9STRA|nr:hypothetical protein Ae201684_004797 [Aphanomyces euteiches]